MTREPLEPTARLYWRLHADVRSKSVRLGISPTQLHIICLMCSGDKTTLSKLACSLYLSHATLSDTLKTLVSRGIVDRQINHADRRSHLLSLTAEGVRIYEEFAAIPDLLKASLGRLPLEHQQMYQQITQQILDGLNFRGSHGQ